MQTATKTVTRGIYNRVSTGQFVGGVEQFRHIKTGEQTTIYNISVDDTTLTINGNVYRLEYVPGYSIQIRKTKVKTMYNAEQLIKFFMDFDTSGGWIEKVITNCKPIKRA